MKKIFLIMFLFSPIFIGKIVAQECKTSIIKEGDSYYLIDSNCKKHYIRGMKEILDMFQKEKNKKKESYTKGRRGDSNRYDDNPNRVRVNGRRGS